MGVNYDLADPQAVWHTQTMDPKEWKSRDICATGFIMLFVIPGLKMPAGMGFRVGQGTGINFLTFCAHYHTHSANMSHGDSRGETQETRLQLVTVAEASSAGSSIKTAGLLLVSKEEGLLLLTATGTSVTYDYRIPDPIVMHAVAVTLHSHAHGTGIQMWGTRQDGKRIDLMSASITRSTGDVIFSADQPTIGQGDRLSIRCHYNVTELTRIG